MSDALASLRTALAPKGMRRIPIPLESYQHPSVPLSSKYLLNMYAEAQTANAHSEVALLPSAGLSLLAQVGSGPIGALNDDLPGMIYVVAGTGLYRVDAVTFTSLYLGDVGTPTGGVAKNMFYSIAVGPEAAVVCTPPNAYAVSHTGTTVRQITTTWPEYGASSVTYLDSFFVFTGQQKPDFFFCTKAGDASTVDALDFAALDAFPNAARRVFTLGTDLWFAGDNGWEIWYTAGNQDFPFRRRPNGNILQRTIVSPQSIGKGDRRLFWVSTDGHVYRTNGYAEERISTSALEHFFGTGVTAPSIHSAYVTQSLGHIYYTLNFTDVTYVFDALTKAWHNVASTADGTGRRVGNCAAINNPIPIIGDDYGRLLRFDHTASTDVGVMVKRQVVLPPLVGAPGIANAYTKRAFCSRLEVEMETGTVNSPGQIVLEWSDDGGHTYTGSRTMTVGSADAAKRRRVYATRLGSYRNRVFRITSMHSMSIYAISADISDGAS